MMTSRFQRYSSKLVDLVRYNKRILRRRRRHRFRCRLDRRRLRIQIELLTRLLKKMM